jgi:diguanylate cyclase (GGDEF)-like protein
VWPLALAGALVVLTVWVAGEVAARHERENTDTRLTAALRAARGALGERLEAAQSQAEQLGSSRAVQRALARNDRAAATRLAEENVSFFTEDGLLAGRSAPAPAAAREIEVVGEDGRPLGRVVVSVPMDEALLDELGVEAGLAEGDVLAAAHERELLAATGPLEPPAAMPLGQRGEGEVGDQEYRFVSTQLLADTDIRLVALASTEPIEDAAADTRLRALLAALATVLLVALAAWTLRLLLGRNAPAEADSLRRRARDERQAGRRVRDAVALVGEALAATHDPEALLPVILQSTIDATGAAGARVVSGGQEVVSAGDPEGGGEPLSLSLGADEDGIGRLLLYPPPGGAFDQEAEQLAHWLAAQASIALENERLHRTVKRQAITDELTQLANRRRFTETLAHEVRRAERFGGTLALVLADLDDFKAVNDRYGHGVGDQVLCRFADVLRESVRDFDLPVRLGGEEFAVLLPETTLAGGEQLARRLAAALDRVRIPEIAKDRPPVTASFGVASYPEEQSPEELLRSADEALYRAKAEGKNRVVSAVSDPGRTA